MTICDEKGGTAMYLPAWVPEDAKHYLAHTEGGEAIRKLARMAGCHASTVLRQVRRIEDRPVAPEDRVFHPRPLPSETRHAARLKIPHF